MAILPDVSVSIQDGAQGLVSSASDQVHAIIGACSKGQPNTLYSFGALGALVDELGEGPAVEAAAHSLAIAGGPIYVVPVAQSTPGAPGSVTQAGAGPTVTAPAISAVVATGASPPAVTVTGTPTKALALAIEVVDGGTLGTATLRASLDDGDTWLATQATAATVALAGTGLTLAFPAGTYATEHTYRCSTCVPADAYEVRLEIVNGGALGVATYRYALDALAPGGATWSPILTTPANGLVTLPGGVVLTLASGTYVAGTTYSLQCSAPGYSANDVKTALRALLADPREWGAVHLVGQAVNAAGSASIASTLDTELEAAASGSFRYAMTLCEAADVADADLITAFKNFASKRVSVCAGFCRITSAIDGRSYKRSSGVPITARLSRVGISVDLGRVLDGSLPGVTHLYRDEQTTPALDASRFATLRSIVGRQGYYVTNGRIMAPAGSDFTLTQYRRVMDVACRVGRDALMNFLNAGVRINRVGGTIFELDARAIEADVTARLNASLTQPGHATAVTCVVDRSNNVQSTQTLRAQVRITPLGYAKNITLDIGYSSPSSTPS